MPSRHIRSLRPVALLAILALPVLTVWNLAIEPIAPQLRIRIMGLVGVTVAPAPLHWTLAAVADGTLQGGIARALAEAMPLRDLLIRVNNEVRYTAFGHIGAPKVVEGDNSELIEPDVVAEYCLRRPDTGATKAAELIPKLKDIQAYYTSRHRPFLFVVTPSKAAHMPEYFVHRFPCPNAEADRVAKVPTMVRLLRQAGINVFDAATMTHNLKGTVPVDLFPRGGIHWNRIAIAHAAEAITAEINRQAERAALPDFTWSYRLSSIAHGIDRDLVNLLNLMVPRIRYKTAVVSIQPATSCGIKAPPSPKVALVGGSFQEGIAQFLNEATCLSNLNLYLYLTQLRYGGVPPTYQFGLSESEIAPIRDADVLILEENEATAGESSHIARLHALLTGR